MLRFGEMFHKRAFKEFRVFFRYGNGVPQSVPLYCGVELLRLERLLFRIAMTVCDQGHDATCNFPVAFLQTVVHPDQFANGERPGIKSESPGQLPDELPDVYSFVWFRIASTCVVSSIRFRRASTALMPATIIRRCFSMALARSVRPLWRKKWIIS